MPSITNEWRTNVNFKTIDEEQELPSSSQFYHFFHPLVEEDTLDTSPIPPPPSLTTFPARNYARNNDNGNVEGLQNKRAKKHYQPLFSKFEVMAWKALLVMKSDIQEFDRELLLDELHKLVDEASEIEHVTADVVKLNMQDKDLEAIIVGIAGTCGLFVSTSTDLTKPGENNEISKNEFKFGKEKNHTGQIEALKPYIEETEPTARNNGSEMTEEINTEELRKENQETASGKVKDKTAEIAIIKSNALMREIWQELLNLELKINTDMNIHRQRKEEMETIKAKLHIDSTDEKALMLDADKREIRQKIDELEAEIEDGIVMQEWRKEDLEATLAELQEEIRLEEMKNKELEDNIHGIKGRLINTHVQTEPCEAEDTYVQTEPCDLEENPCARQLTMHVFSCLQGSKCWKH